MPPYAAQEEQHLPAAFDLNNHELSLVEVPVEAPKLVEEQERTTADASSTDESSFELLEQPIDTDKKSKSKPSVLGRLLDFNPCTMKVGNPSSALFKVRVCSECGKNVHKLRGGGYQKELKQQHRDATFNDAGEESVTKETKVYFHPRCLTIREDRTLHKESGFGAVLIELREHFEAKAREQALVAARREAEAAAAKAAEAARRALLEAAPLKTQHRRRGRRSGFLKRTKRALKVVSWNACGTKQHGADESAFEGAVSI
jgi:hypothetical protein